MNLRRSVIVFLGLSLAPIAAVTGPIHAQQQQPPQQQTANRGSITGVVRAASSGQPLSAAQVSIAGTASGAITGTDGRYNIPNVPGGIYTLVAKRLGYSASTKENLRVANGPPTVADFSMSDQALMLTGVVTTGLSDPTSGGKAPFSVATVTGEKLDVPGMGSPLEVLQGRVAGLQIRGGTRPGSDVVIQIRNPLSISGFTQPMIIVDGVIQMQDDPTINARSISGNPLDLNGDNIESIEIVRGAAAAALYGQRAANGVINITTKRGGDQQAGRTSMTLSSEYGFSQLGRALPQTTHHSYLVDENNQFITTLGVPVTCLQESCLTRDPNGFTDNEYGVPVYDNVKALYHIGSTIRGNLQLSQNSLSTNFGVSASSLQESGVLKTGGGTARQNLGFNLDYRAGNALAAGFGISYVRTYTREVATETSFQVAQDISKTVSILAIDPATGDYFPFPDGVNGNRFNPLYLEDRRDEWQRRMGAQANGQLTLRPTPVVSFSFTGGYQRSDTEEQIKWVPPGTIYSGGTIAAGEYDFANAMDETYNGLARASILTGMGGWTFRVGLSTGGQLQKRNSVDLRADILSDIARDVDLAENVFADQNTRDVRTQDYSANVAFDYNQKYILDVVYRSDGSSLLPAATRFQSNGRASVAWKISEEPWWPLADFTDFKPRYSIGTAGNNPPLAARFELYSKSDADGADRISKQNLGNINIVPEEVTEQEFGLDMTFRNRYSLSLTYVRNTVKNTIRPDTILAYTGFETQQANLGDLRGDSYEATLEAQWIQQRNLRWSSTLTLDRGRQKVTSYPRRCNAAQTTSTLNRICEGYVFGDMYGYTFVTDSFQLSPRHLGSSTHESTVNQFDINDEGWMVAVGPNGRFSDGRWGQTVVIDGFTYDWGFPILENVFNPDGTIETLGKVTRIGHGLPEVSFGLGNSVTYNRFTVNIQTVGQLGGHIFNKNRKNSVIQEVDPMLDQFGKPDYAKKPRQYYTGGIRGGSASTGISLGTAGSNEDIVTKSFLEPGDFLKVTELRVSYRLDQGLPLLRKLGMTGGSVALVARDLLTITSYSGYDPQVAGATSFTSARTDDNFYPNYKNFTASLRLIF